MTRRSSERIVSTWPLKSWRWTWTVARKRRSSSRSGPCTSERPEVDDDLERLAFGIGTLAVAADLARARRRDLARLRRQELVDRHVVELRQPLQARHRDRALTPLVGAEHRGLELQPRGLLDRLEREPLLASHSAQASTDRDGVLRVLAFGN